MTKIEDNSYTWIILPQIQICGQVLTKTLSFLRPSNFHLINKFVFKSPITRSVSARAEISARLEPSLFDKWL